MVVLFACETQVRFQAHEPVFDESELLSLSVVVILGPFFDDAFVVEAGCWVGRSAIAATSAMKDVTCATTPHTDTRTQRERERERERESPKHRHTDRTLSHTHHRHHHHHHHHHHHCRCRRHQKTMHVGMRMHT